MKKHLLLPIYLMFSMIVFSQSEKYSRVRIFTDQTGLKKLAGLGIAIDHGSYRKGVYFESDFSETEIQKIKFSGIKYEVKIDDVSEYYRQQNENSISEKTKAVSACNSGLKNYSTPANFSLGSMGGYFKYAQFLAHLDSMSAKFPNLITARQPIDTFHSIEGREIFWLKISDNPNSDENEPQVLYTALHHAREPASLSQMIFYMWYLLENYGANPEVTYLVNHTELFFIPMINPDGYIYNETTNPNGGGMWRKNRRPHGANQFGVDLNRNYDYHWGYNDSGSSPDSSAQTYRGKFGFSEPETQAVKFFCENHRLSFILNYHTYGDLFIYPWNYEENIYTPDSAYFVTFSVHATNENAYNFGTANQTVGYTANGDSDDWMYGEQTSKNKIFAATPEAGPADFGFWPPSSKIVEICKANLNQNLITAHFALKYARAQDLSPYFFSTHSGQIPFKIQNLGLDTPANFTVTISAVSPEFTSIGAGKTFSSMNVLEEITDSIPYSIDTSVQSGTEIKFVMAIDNGLYITSDTISKVFGTPAVIFAENGNSINNWNSNTWGTSGTMYYSPSSSITDSPNGNYSNNSFTKITLDSAIDLTSALDAVLNFWARWEIEPGYDYARVLASSDNGNNWTPLCGKYTKAGNANQDEGNPIYDGMQQSWVFEEISLKEFVGKNMLLRFDLTSDGWLNFDGFYFDDLTVEIISDTATVAVEPVLNPKVFLSQNLPNPASGYAYLNYSVPESGQIIIYNSVGEKMARLAVSHQQHSVKMDLAPLSTGIYFYQFISENFLSEIKKMAVIK